MTTERLCKGCNNPLVKHATETSYRFSHRNHCSMECDGARRKAAAEALRLTDVKTCPCGVTYRRKLGEAHARFVGRKFCKRSCPAFIQATLRQSGGRRALRPLKSKPKLTNGPLTTYVVGKRVVRIAKPEPGTVFEDPAQWLQTHQPTKVPTRYCAPVIGA